MDGGERRWQGVFMVLVLLGPHLAGCGEAAGSSSTSTEPLACGPGETDRIGAAGCCHAGQLPLEDGTCLDAGMQVNGCAAGDVGVEGGPAAGGGCRPAGVPPEMCAAGFETDGESGCNAILPAEACPKGRMAVPGETACREVSPCGSGKWGEAPVDGDTVFVDGAYAGENGVSDGGESRPWKTIQEGIDNALPGALVAVAEGTYPEDVDIAGSDVRLWGRCPDLVEIVGSSQQIAAVFIRKNAGGTELHDLAIRGSAAGVASSGSEDVLLDRVWIHDTAGRGVTIEDPFGPTAMEISRSLVELATDAGIFVQASTAHVESSLVRDTRPFKPGNDYGRGIESQDNPSGEGATLAVFGSVVERNHDVGISVLGSEAVIEATVVRDTLHQVSDKTGGFGIYTGINGDTGKMASATLRQVVVERNRTVGIVVNGSEAEMEAVIVWQTLPRLADSVSGRGMEIVDSINGGLRSKVTVRSSLFRENHDVGIAIGGSDVVVEGVRVRDTLPQVLDNRFGTGIAAEDQVDTLSRAVLEMRSSVVERSSDLGIFVGGSDATIEGVLVQDTRPRQDDMMFGWGIAARDNPMSGERANLVLRSSVLDASHDMGLVLGGSDGLVEATVVRNTLPRAADQRFGRGITVQIDPMDGAFSSVEINGCDIGNNYEVGVSVHQSSAVLRGTYVHDTHARATDGLLGDGVAFESVGETTTGVVQACRIEGNHRAGLTAFGADVSVERSLFLCNPTDLDAEPSGELPPAVHDHGGNACGCSGSVVACQSKTLGFDAPEPTGDLSP